MEEVFKITQPILLTYRKLKKMYRTYKEEKDGSADEEDKDSKREPQRWDLDYDLEPYEGLSPEYMEMGEYHMLELNNRLKCQQCYNPQDIITLCFVATWKPYLTV